MIRRAGDADEFEAARGIEHFDITDRHLIQSFSQAGSSPAVGAKIPPATWLVQRSCWLGHHPPRAVRDRQFAFL